MANTTSAKKAARKMVRRTAVNKNRRSRVRTYLRKVEEAIASGDKSAAQDALKAVQPELMRAAGKGVMHRNTASRKVSRLASRVKSIGAGYAASRLPELINPGPRAGLFRLAAMGCGRANLLCRRDAAQGVSSRDAASRPASDMASFSL